VNKNSLIIGLGISGIFSLMATTGVVHEKTPPSIAQCDKQAEHSEAALRYEAGYELSPQQRMDYLHIGVMRRECIDEAKAGPRLTIAGL
jgi:hypothetical protein